MKKIILSVFFLAMVIITNAQTPKAELPFKYDQLYKTMFAKELCDFIQKHPDLVLIDVRTAGEYSDTSRYASFNQGHLKGAVNINNEEIKKDIALLNPYKDKPIVLYCSHSQRSRRISKLLSENGFTNFYNLNGGMSSLNQLTETEFPCKNEWIVSNLSYKNCSANEAFRLIKNEKNLTIIDVRTTNQFNSTDTSVANNIGRIKGAINIPYDELNAKINAFIFSKEKPVLIVGETGDGNPARAADTLLSLGFKRVYQLLGGMDNFIATQSTASVLENTPLYHLINAPQALKLLQTNSKLVVYDTRNDDEYNNKLTGADAYKNLGHMKNAIHVTAALFNNQKLPANKAEQILVYGNYDAYTFAKHLTDKGYAHVYLMPGFYDFVWSGFNVESCKEAKKFVVDHQDQY